MSWLRIDDGFPQHPKLAGWTPTQKWALIELFTYCAKQRTEGHVPADLSLLPRAVTRKVLELAEDSGILDRDEDGSLVVHDWAKYNPSDATAAERMQRMRERNAKRNSGRNDDRNASVTSRARDPVPSPVGDKSPTPKREPDELWEALVTELGEALTKTERGRRNAALKELREVGATPEEIHKRCRVYRREWPEVTLTANALAANWSTLASLGKPQTAPPPPVDEVLNFPDISEEERLQNAERIRAMASGIGRTA